MEGYQLRIALKDIPAVWRRVLVPAGITFRTLHRVIQFAMGWQDCHLHEFSSDDDPTVYTDNSEAIAENQYYLKNPEELQHEFMRSILQTPMKSSGSVKIDSILQRSGRLKYVYDLGDEWEHEVVLEDVVDLANAFPVCIGAGEACPPEDVGGPSGYMDFLEAWHDPRHEDHKNSVMWATSYCTLKAMSQSTRSTWGIFCHSSSATEEGNGRSRSSVTVYWNSSPTFWIVTRSAIDRKKSPNRHSAGTFTTGSSAACWLNSDS
jgi:hypothetical protein